MTEPNLPGPARRDAAWRDLPPDPFEAPGLYDGLLGRRIAGFLIDWAILLLIYGMAWLVGGLVTALSFGLLGPAVIALIAALPILYNALTIGLWGATPGMSLMDVEIRSWDGGPASLLQALVFSLIFYLTVPTTSGIALLFVFFTERRRTVHDFLSNTVAVRHSALASD